MGDLGVLHKERDATYEETYDEPGGTWLGLYEYHTQADTTWENHTEASTLYDYGHGISSTRDVNNFSRTTHDVWEGSKLTQGYCTVSEEGVKISGELGSITRTTEIHNQGKQQDWTNVLTRGSETYTKTGSSTDTSLCTESPTVHSRSITNDWQESVSGFLGTTTRTKHSSQVWSSDGQTGTKQSEWLDTVLCPNGQLITLGSSSTTEAWTCPGSNVTVTGTGASGQPTPPTYTGPDDEHFDDLVAALLDHAQDLADQAQNATLTTASRAALVDAAILSFTALDADENGQNGGAVYTRCATPPEGEGGEPGGGGFGGWGGPGWPSGQERPESNRPRGPHANVGFRGGNVQFIHGDIDAALWERMQAAKGDDRQIIGVDGRDHGKAKAGQGEVPITWTGFLDMIQGGLDAAGVGDPTPICDGINALISLLRANYEQAACSAVAMFPYLGDLAKLSKYGKKVVEAGNDALKWLGKNSRMIRNEAGDLIFVSQDGLRRIRFDFNKPHPHKNPHVHVEEKVTGGWRKSGPLYPTDVPHH